MTVQFRTQQEVKGINDFGQQYSDQIYNATLVAAVNSLFDSLHQKYTEGMKKHGSTL